MRNEDLSWREVRYLNEMIKRKGILVFLSFRKVENRHRKKCTFKKRVRRKAGIGKTTTL